MSIRLTSRDGNSADVWRAACSLDSISSAYNASGMNYGKYLFSVSKRMEPKRMNHHLIHPNPVIYRAMGGQSVKQAFVQARPLRRIFIP